MHTQNDETKTGLNRRVILLTACACGVVAGKATLAGGGGGGQEDGQTSTSKPKNEVLRKKGRPTVQTHYTQNEFMRLSAEEMYHLIDQQQVYRKNIKIDGFSRNMSSFIVSMAAYRRRRTQGLMRDMSRIKNNDKRKLRLLREVNWAEREVEKLQRALERAKKLKLKTAVYETRMRISDAKDFLKGVKVWSEFPWEGTRK